MKAKWRRPEVLSIAEASEAYGHCQEGSTAAPNLCHNGQSTSSDTTTPHACGMGGYAQPVPANCSIGSNYVPM